MDENVEFLNYIYQNSKMGIDTIKQLLEITKDEEYKHLLQSQYDEYKKIFDTAEEKLKMHNKEGKDINMYNKISSYIMINLNTLLNKTPSMTE